MVLPASLGLSASFFVFYSALFAPGTVNNESAYAAGANTIIRNQKNFSKSTKASLPSFHWTVNTHDWILQWMATFIFFCFFLKVHEIILLLKNYCMCFLSHLSLGPRGVVEKMDRMKIIKRRLSMSLRSARPVDDSLSELAEQMALDETPGARENGETCACTHTFYMYCTLAQTQTVAS